MDIQTWYTIFLAIQFFHSVEELSTGFHRQFPPFAMSFTFFLLFEIIFFSFFLGVLLLPLFPARFAWMTFFNLLMFVNGWWHIVWAGIKKKYVPGLYTAPLFVIVFVLYYSDLLIR